MSIMARKSRWSSDQRKKLLKMVRDEITEQEIRKTLTTKGKSEMSAVEFGQQLKMAMVEAGEIKQQSKRKKTVKAPSAYEVTAKGRLTINDFADKTGFKTGDSFTIEKPRGKSKAWRIVPK
jgi:Ca2+-binding EF-hand superfamily protein